MTFTSIERKLKEQLKSHGRKQGSEISLWRRLTEREPHPSPYLGLLEDLDLNMARFLWDWLVLWTSYKLSQGRGHTLHACSPGLKGEIDDHTKCMWYPLKSGDGHAWLSAQLPLTCFVSCWPWQSAVPWLELLFATLWHWRYCWLWILVGLLDTD